MITCLARHSCLQQTILKSCMMYIFMFIYIKTRLFSGVSQLMLRSGSCQNSACNIIQYFPNVAWGSKQMKISDMVILSRPYNEYLTAILNILVSAYLSLPSVNRFNMGRTWPWCSPCSRFTMGRTFMVSLMQMAMVTSLQLYTLALF